MNNKGYSINLGEKGKEYFPITGVVGYSDDGTSFSVKVNLKPHHEYQFVITDRSFASAEGYPLRPYEVKFKTR
jgi:hypothetical protein